jgi:2-polyprenyl-6-methoxyphenol hydroxylase-like FAD-dependent oxidoreductase
VLYDQFQHKERVRVNKKVVKIHHIDGGMNVATDDGDKFSGTFVLGIDGIHNTVRSLMTSTANQHQPGYFDPGEASRVPCYYRCSFGIAQDVPQLPPGQIENVMGNGYSELVISGPDKRIYWFIFKRLPEPRFGKGIPRYTKEDEADFVKQHWNLPITDKVTFGQIYSKRLSSTLTPLHEVVYEKWFLRSIITLGDSAHRVSKQKRARRKK